MLTYEDSLTVAVRGRATSAGENWARELRATLLVERRRTSGGWPGTMTEARARVAAAVLPWSVPRGESPPTEAERENAARLLYASARSAWLTNAEPNIDDDD
jgi:hypothetical protein